MMAVQRKQLNEAETIDLARCYEKMDRLAEVSRRQQALLAAAAMDGPQKRWAIVKVARNRENDVDKSLSAALIEHWLPLRKTDQPHHGGRAGRKKEPLWTLAWPGYILVKVANLPEAWAGIATIKHTIAVLGANEIPFFIDDATVLKIKAELATLKDVPANAGKVFSKGERVQVSDGPFASFPATISALGEGSHEGRAWVEVMIFGRMVPVDLDLAQLSKS